MAIIITCPNPSCRKEIGIAEKSVGRKVSCPLCKHQFVASAPAPGKPQGSVQPKPLPPTKAATPKRSTAETAAFQTAAHQNAAAQKAAPGRADVRIPAIKGQAEAEKRMHQPVRFAPGLPLPVGIACLAVLLLAIIIGAVYVVPMMFGPAAGWPSELFVKLQQAAKTDDTSLLRQILYAEDRTAVDAGKPEMVKFLSLQPGADPSLASKASMALLLDCLHTRQFNINSWRYVKAVTRGGEGVVVFQDDMDNSPTIPIIRTGEGWRLRLADFCLPLIRRVNAINEPEPAPAASTPPEQDKQDAKPAGNEEEPKDKAPADKGADAQAEENEE